MFANIKHSITVFNDHLFDVCEDSSKCEKRLCLAGLLISQNLLDQSFWMDANNAFATTSVFNLV